MGHYTAKGARGKFKTREEYVSAVVRLLEEVPRKSYGVIAEELGSTAYSVQAICSTRVVNRPPNSSLQWQVMQHQRRHPTQYNPGTVADLLGVSRSTVVYARRAMGYNCKEVRARVVQIRQRRIEAYLRRHPEATSLQVMAAMGEGPLKAQRKEVHTIRAAMGRAARAKIVVPKVTGAMALLNRRLA